MRTTLSSANAIWLVVQREVKAQVQSKAFIISFIVLLVFAFGGAYLGGTFATSETSQVTVAVTPETKLVIAADPQLAPLVVEDPDAAVVAVKDGTADAALLVDESSPVGTRIVALSEVPWQLLAATEIGPPVELLSPEQDLEAQFDFMEYLVAMVFGLVFMLSVTIFGQVIAQNTVVEKQTRTVELLLSTVSSQVLLAGKILAGSLVAIGQTAGVLLAAALGLAASGQNQLLATLSLPMIWFVVFFVFGFVLFAALFAAAASLVSRTEDVGAVLTPVLALVMTPYFLVLIFGQNLTVMKVASLVPFTSPVAMPTRMFQEHVGIGETLLSLLILLVTDALVILAAARIYRATVLRTGSKIKLRDAWRPETAGRERA